MNQYFKFTEKGELIFVDDEQGRFTYITPPFSERHELRFESLEELMSFIEKRKKNTRWTYYV